MTEQTAKKMSPIKRIAIIAFLIIWPVAIAVFFYWLTISRNPPAEAPQNAPETLTMSLVFLFLGILSLVATVAAYFIAFATQCFTFNYNKPIWKALRVRFYIANIIIPVFAGLTLGLCSAAFLTPILTSTGLSFAVAFAIPCLGMFMVSQFILSYVSIWTPIQKNAVKKRMAAFGISIENMQWGIHMGISDPAKSSLKKLTTIEEDIGMLWIKPDLIVYRGDADGFIIRRGLLAQIERLTDSGSIAALTGALNVVIRFRNQDGTERRVRLHPQDCWTLRQVATKSNDLADQITTWHDNPPGPQ